MCCPKGIELKPKFRRNALSQRNLPSLLCAETRRFRWTPRLRAAYDRLPRGPAARSALVIETLPWQFPYPALRPFDGMSRPLPPGLAEPAAKLPAKTALLCRGVLCENPFRVLEDSPHGFVEPRRSITGCRGRVPRCSTFLPNSLLLGA